MENDEKVKNEKKFFIETISSINIFQIIAMGALQAVVGFWTEKLLKKLWNKDGNKNNQKETQSDEDKE